MDERKTILLGLAEEVQDLWRRLHQRSALFAGVLFAFGVLTMYVGPQLALWTFDVPVRQLLAAVCSIVLSVEMLWAGGQCASGYVGRAVVSLYYDHGSGLLRRPVKAALIAQGCVVAVTARAPTEPPTEARLATNTARTATLRVPPMAMRRSPRTRTDLRTSRSPQTIRTALRARRRAPTTQTKTTPLATATASRALKSNYWRMKRL